MLGILKKLFGEPEAIGSKDIAKERLRLVLVHDRATVSPQYMDLLKDDMIKAVSPYMEINEQDMVVSLNCEDQTVTLVANIPVSSVKRSPASRQVEDANDEEAATEATTCLLVAPMVIESKETVDDETEYTVHGI